MNWKTVKITLLIIGIFGFGFMIQSWRMDKVEHKISVLENKIEHANKENSELRKQLFELTWDYELFRDLTSDEFEKTWVSFARIRGNFVALGKGFHLEDKDITPDKELN